MNVISSQQTESLKSHGMVGGALSQFSNENSMRGGNVTNN